MHCNEGSETGENTIKLAQADSAHKRGDGRDGLPQVRLWPRRGLRGSINSHSMRARVDGADRRDGQGRG